MVKFIVAVIHLAILKHRTASQKSKAGGLFFTCVCIECSLCSAIFFHIFSFLFLSLSNLVPFLFLHKNNDSSYEKILYNFPVWVNWHFLATRCISLPILWKYACGLSVSQKWAKKICELYAKKILYQSLYVKWPL